MENIEVYRVKRPAFIFELICVIFLSLLMGPLLFNTSTINEDKLLFFFPYVWVASCIVVILIWICRFFTVRRFIEIQINPESIVIDDVIIEAKDIKTVFVTGYFKPKIGIKLMSTILVPYKLCFSFLEKEDQGIKELTTWAERNHIKVSSKRFTRWL